MSMTRKDFCGALAGGTVLLLFGCGGGGGGNGDGGGDTTQCGAAGADITANHGHALAIPAADLDSTSDKAYGILGIADHDHTVTFTPAMLQQLKAGMSVVVTSTSAASATTTAHTHTVAARC